MAYLNVRERRLETKIGYVGAAASGKATNLERLGVPRVTDGELALFWQPKDQVSFRDCAVRVEMVAPRGAPSAEGIRALLRTADGIVFVADADPTSQEKNVATLALLREALAEVTHPVPVVVQVNKSDLAAGVDTAAALEIAGWPRVDASAANGEGVVETAERALDLVLEALRRRDVSAESTAVAAPRTDSNPLLNALRQLLRETVVSYVEETEKRSLPKLDAILEAQARHGQELSRLREAVASLSETVSTLGDTAEGTSLESVRQGRVLNELVQGETERMRQLTGLSGLAGVTTQIADLGRQVEALARADREQQAVVASMKRLLEALPAEIRSVDLRAPLQALKVEVERSRSQVVEQLGERLVELDGKTTSLGATYDALIEELKKPKKSWFG